MLQHVAPHATTIEPETDPGAEPYLDPAPLDPDVDPGAEPYLDPDGDPDFDPIDPEPLPVPDPDDPDAPV